MLAPSPALAPQLHDVTVITRKTYACAKAEGVPPEEFGVSRNTKSLRDCGYCFHEVTKTQSQLIDDGYDEVQLAKIPTYGTSETSETQARDTVDESTAGAGKDGQNKANRLIKITEHYVRMDYEGKGKAKLYRVTTGGDQGEILSREGEDDVVEVDFIPFAAMTPVIMTHRFFGRSAADLVMDIQRIKTALVRGLLDNTYLALNPMKEVPESHASENTLDDLLVSRPGGIVRTKQPGGLNVLQHPDISAGIFPSLQYFDATREWRTGVSRQGQGVDPNALQNQVATIANQMFNASQAKVKLIARIFAETGIRDLFSLLHATIRKNGSQAETVKLRNQWVTVNPREWKERNDMTISVGLGTGSKEQQLAGAQLLIGAQEKAIAVGMVSKQNLFNSAKQLTRLLGYKDPEEFFTNPGTPPDPQNPNAAPIEPPPDPKMAELEGKKEIEKLQADADIATTDRKTNAEIVREDRKAKQQMDLALLEHNLKMDEMEADAGRKREAHLQSIDQKTTAHNQSMEQRRADHEQRAEKAEGGPKASIEVKHGADEITGPLSEAIKTFGETMTKTQEQGMAALLAAIESNKRPKRIKSSSGKTFEIEA